MKRRELIMQIELLSDAPSYITKIAVAMGVVNPTAYAMFRMYDADPVKFPALRDRTREMNVAVKALAGAFGGDVESEVQIFNLEGRDMVQYGASIVGAAHGHVFRFIFA